MPAGQPCAAQIQFHATHVGLVCDRRGVNLKHDRAANALCYLDCFVFTKCDVGLDNGNAISCENFLRFDLCEECAFLCAPFG